MNDWPVEEIPNPDSLFYRVSVGWLRPGDLKVAPGVFRENKGAISSDWEKYSTAIQTRSRQGRPERFAVIRMVAGSVREIDGLTVLHSPIQGAEGQIDNRAHTSILGLESPASTKPGLGRKEKIRTELQKRFGTWEIEPNAPTG
jgi:hypothetical protein